jgi:competence protein ComK
MGMKYVKDYQISLTTMGIEAVYHPEYNSRIYDVNGMYYTGRTNQELLDQACELRCTDYNGRINAVRKAFSYDKKTPLVICPIEMIYAIPTKSPKDYDCKWIFPDHIEKLLRKAKHPQILFKNGLTMEINCSYNTFKKQQERARNSLIHFFILVRERSTYRIK